MWMAKPVFYGKISHSKGKSQFLLGKPRSGTQTWMFWCGKTNVCSVWNIYLSAVLQQGHFSECGTQLSWRRKSSIAVSSAQWKLLSGRDLSGNWGWLLVALEVAVACDVLPSCSPRSKTSRENFGELSPLRIQQVVVFTALLCNVRFYEPFGVSHVWNRLCCQHPMGTYVWS